MSFNSLRVILEIGALLQNPQGMVDTLGDTDLPGEKVGRHILRRTSIFTP